MTDSFEKKAEGATVPSDHVLVEGVIENGNGNWKSRKFVASVGSAFAMMAYAGVGRPLKWIGEDTLIYLMTAGLIAIFAYCGVNLAEKGGFSKLLTPFKKIGAMLAPGKKK